MKLSALEPQGIGWVKLAVVTTDGDDADLWINVPRATQVLSSLVMARLPRSGTTGPQWHVSVVDRSAREPERPSAAQVLLARCAFGLLTAEEDNHHPGKARHFWMPVDLSERVDCECKTDETVVTDADGYQWTNPVDGPCRGCTLERVFAEQGRPPNPCPIHGARIVLKPRTVGFTTGLRPRSGT